MVRYSPSKLLVEKCINLKKTEIDAAVVKFREYYAAHLLETTRLFPGVRECLDGLKGVKKVLLTNKPEAFTRDILKGLKIEGYFEAEIGVDTVPKKKPDPYHINELVKKYPRGQNFLKKS